MTTTLAPSPSIDQAVGQLVLARMAIPAKSAPAPSKVREAVGKLLDAPLSQAEFDELRNGLAAEGWLARGKRNAFTLTDAGRQQALQFLKLKAFPPRATWTTVIAKCLFPQAAELTEAAAAKLKSAEQLAGLVLKRKYRLTSAAGNTIKQVLPALVCQELGFPEEHTFEGLLCAVLSKHVGSERLTKDKLLKTLPTFETGVKTASADAVRKKFIQDWLAKPTQSQSQPVQSVEKPQTEPFDPEAFAATVRTLAASSPPQDRFHDNKVFIAALWRASQREPAFPRLSLGEFKAKLIDANAKQQLHLSRADLVAEMDPQLVAESETTYLNATFHFVLLAVQHSPSTSNGASSTLKGAAS